MAFDGIVTNSIILELQQINGARIDKIFQPNKNEIILGFYKDGRNYALNICTDSQNYRIHLSTHLKPNPQTAPNFCMVLRKHLIGLHIKNFIISNLERVITIEFEGLDDIDDLIEKKLIIELMGKHCNIILVDESNIIIDSLRHIYGDDNELTRNIAPHQKYTFPPSSKLNFLDLISFDDFKSKLFSNHINKDLTCEEACNLISDTFTGISKIFLLKTLELLNISVINDTSLEKLYDYLYKIIFMANTSNLEFETIYNKDNNPKDYFLLITKNTSDDLFKLNSYIDDFYYAKESSNDFKNYRNSILRLILNVLKKYNQRLTNINSKLNECKNMDTYKLYGELITANLYKIENKNIDKIELENYYDNNNLITIPLNKQYIPSENAKRYFKKYNKLKNTLEIVSKQKEETMQELDYIESIVYELENSENIKDVNEIYEEISENVIFKEKLSKNNKNKNSKIKKSKLTQNKNTTFNPIKYIVDAHTLLIGRNNKENDYLTLKYAKKTDVWFHTKDIHGSHGILITENNVDIISNIQLCEKCAKIVAYHSKAKNSSNVPVDMCLVKYVKKPNNAKPRNGYIYKSNYIVCYSKHKMITLYYY